MAKYPKMSAAKNPANNTPVVASKEVISLTWTNAAPNMAGIDNKKLYLAASSRFNPENKPAAIVDPDLEIPGAIDKAWNIPITIAFFNVISLTSLCPGFTLSEAHNKIPVIIRNMPT